MSRLEHCSPIAILGNAGGTNVGESLRRAALAARYQVHFFDSLSAAAGPRVLRTLSWRLAGRRPLRLKQISEQIVHACARIRPKVLIATGAAPVTKSALRSLRALGIRTANFSTDDPWNSVHRSAWHLSALPAFDLVFTPRHANLGDFKRIGCSNVSYLPFAYDTLLNADVEQPGNASTSDVLFVGGADKDRVDFMKTFIRLGPSISLCGAYWDRYSPTRPHTIGHKSHQAVSQLTAAAKVNLCLVRRANRDGHVMRSFEIPAIGGCMLVEDTEEHRELFGADGESVVYFRTPEEAATRAKRLVSDPAERLRLAAAVRARITSAPNTYHDRLSAILDAAASLESSARAVEFAGG